jgi:hypothetical protein
MAGPEPSGELRVIVVTDEFACEFNEAVVGVAAAHARDCSRSTDLAERVC